MPNKFVVFNGTDQNNLTSLWITDGTSAGTSELSVTGASANGLNPTNFTQFGSEVAFEGADANGHSGLWVTDGTSAGTSELSVAGAASGGVNPQSMAAFGGKLFFEGADTAGNLNLWVSDGTSGGTSELSIPGAATTGFHPLDMTVFGSELLLGGYDTNNHYNLWVSDGTAAGTSELQVAGTFPLGLIPQDMTPFGTKVLFNGDDQAGHNNLWVTDGTGAGTSELSVAGASANGLNPLGITVLGSKVLFEGVDASNQTGLWVSDGTAAGTSELAVANAYSGGLNPFDLTVLGNNVFFEGQDTSGQYGLWKTDGTAAGTSELSIGAPGYNTYLASNGKDVLFDGNYNLWVTDGTSAGTSELSAAGASPTLAPSFMTSVAFPVSAATSTLVASPGSVTADGVSTTTLTVTVEDAHGNAIAGTAVTLSGSGSGNSFGTISGTTNAQGVFTTTLASTVAQTETITATEGSVHESTSVTFNPGAPSATTSTLVASPGSVTADGVSTTMLTVTVEDAHGNLVPNAAVTLSSSGTGDVFGATSGTTNAQGVFTTTLSSTTAQAADTITATEGGVHESTSVTFNPGAPSATTSTLVASPGSVTADGVSTTTLTVTVEDAHGNLVPNAAVTLSGSGSGNSFGTISGSTNASGVFTTTLASTVAQTETITATEGSVHESTSVTFNPGAPSATTSTLVASPGSVTADGVSNTTLAVTVEDAQGNLVPNAAVTLSGSGTANSFGAISGTTNANGVFTTTLASTVAQTETITATEGSVHESTSVTFNPGAPSATTSTLVATPGSVTADGVSTTTLTVTVEDAHGNLVPNAAVTLSGSGAGDVFGATTGTTNAQGVFTTTLSSTTAQADTITATEGSVHETTSVTFNPGAPSATTSTLVATPGSVTADGVSTTTLTVTVEDAHGNLVPNAAVTLSSSGAGDVFGATSGTTNAQGVFTTTLTSTVAQTETITATEGSVHESTSVTFNPGAPSATTSTLVASPVTPDGTTTLTVTVEDANGNLVPNAAVMLSSSGAGDVFGATSGTTNAQGVFTTTLLSTTAQTADTITATESSAHETTTVTFPTTIIESFGATSLVEVGNQYHLNNSNGSGPTLEYNGAPVVAGQFGNIAPIAAEQTATGYEVAWKFAGADQYSIWNTDANSNFVSGVGGLSGTSTALESLETSFHQDLNGDGVIGVVSTTIESFGATSLVEVGNQYHLNNSNGSGPTLEYNGAPVVAGQFGNVAPIAAEQTATGYEVAWKFAGTDQYSIWNTDANGNFVSGVGGLSGTSTALESLETSFHQDLNGDGVIGVVSTTIESFGATSLVEVGNQYHLNNSNGSGPTLEYNGAPVVAGQFGNVAPIAAEQTATGHEVAWKFAGTDQYSIWNTDANGNFVSGVGGLSGTSTALESLETSFHQDLNGDGVIGVVSTTIESFGATSLVEVGNQYHLNNSNGSGPTLEYNGAPVVAGQFGNVAPIAAEQTATGYEVAWKFAGTDQYSIWNTDANGNFVSGVGGLSGTSTALESLETSFHQDLNGDGVIGVVSTTIESFGATSLVEVGNQYHLNNSNGSGPTLEYNGAPVVAGQFGNVAPIAAEQTATGHEVAWKFAGTDQYSIWNTDANGNFVSGVGGLSGTSTALESLETSFHQDLNGDGVIGQTSIAIGTTTEIPSAFSGAITFAGSSGTLQLDSSATFTGTVANLTGLDTLDLRGINPATVQTPIYSGNSTSGTLTVADGVHAINIALLGNYLASSFAASSDGHGGTSVIDPLQPPLVQQTVLTQPQHA